MTKYIAALSILSAFVALPSFAQSAPGSAPMPRAEDPAYLENSNSDKSYTVEEESETDNQAEGNMDADRAPASQPQPSYAQPQQPSSNMTQQPSQPSNGGKAPIFLQDIQKNQTGKTQAQPTERGQRYPASEPATAAPAGTSQTSDQSKPVGSQISFFEITPTIGAISILDKTAFTIGSNLSFNILRNQPLYLEPSVYLSFLSGDNNKNTTIFHIDGGLRYDFIINGSPVVPFAKAAVGPSLSSNSGVTTNNGADTVSDSYVNVFAGGGLRLLLNPHVTARIDTGVTFQGTNPGLYVMGAAGLPL